MSIYIHIKELTACINFLGIPIPIDKAMYNPELWICFDQDGEVHVFGDKPEILGKNFWSHPVHGRLGVIKIFDLCVLDYIPNLDAWMETEWSKDCWPITTFPLVEL